MVTQERMGDPKGIRWPGDLETEIEEAAAEDDRVFSDEVRVLVKLGLKNRARSKRPKSGGGT
jgi:hypothetical protein